MDDDAPARAKIMEHWFLPTPSTRPRGGQRWPSRCRTTVQADADDRESAR